MRECSFHSDLIAKPFRNFVNAHIITHITHNTHHRHKDMRRWRMWMQYKSELNQKRASAGEEKKRERETRIRKSYIAPHTIQSWFPRRNGIRRRHAPAPRGRAVEGYNDSRTRLNLLHLILIIRNVRTFLLDATNLPDNHNFIRIFGFFTIMKSPCNDNTQANDARNREWMRGKWKC